MRHLKKLINQKAKKNLWLERKRQEIEKRKKREKKFKRKRFFKNEAKEHNTNMWNRDWFRDFYDDLNNSNWDSLEAQDEKLHEFTHDMFQLKWQNPKLRWIEKINISFFLNNCNKDTPLTISRFYSTGRFFELSECKKNRWQWLIQKELLERPRKFRFIFKHNRNLEVNSRILAFSIISSEFLHRTVTSTSQPMAFTHTLNKFIRHFF